MSAANLDLAVIGNGCTAALVEPSGRIVWWCLPRYDGDPVFCRLLAGDEEKGFTDVVLDGQVEIRSDYVRNTAIVGNLTRRRQWRCGSYHRFRATLPELWPHLPPAAARAHHRADRRDAAHHDPLPHRAPLRRTGDHALVRQQPYALLARRRAGTADHRCAALLCRERGLVRAHAPGAHGDGAWTSRLKARSKVPAGNFAIARVTIGWNGCDACRSRSTGRTRLSAPASPSSSAASRRPARSWRHSPPRSRKGRAGPHLGLPLLLDA